MSQPDPDPAASSAVPRPATSVTEAEVMVAITEITREHLRWTGPIARNLPLVETLALDSLRQLTLVVEIENRFRIQFDPQDELSVTTFGDLAALIGRKLDQRTSDAR